MDNVSNLHIIIHCQGNGDDIRSIQLFIDYTAADGIAIQTDQKVEQRGAV